MAGGRAILRFTKAARLLVHPRWRIKWRKPEGTLPIPQSRDDLFSKQSRHACPVQLPKRWWVATVLPRALRFKRPLHRCNACDPRTGSQWSCSTTSRSRSVRLPTGGGTLVRFNFQEKWSLRLDSHQHLTAYETAALLYATERKNSIRQPDLRRPLPVTNGVRRFLRFGGF